MDKINWSIVDSNINYLTFNDKIKTFETTLKQNFTIVGDPTNIKNCQ